jgi:2-oxoglutarate dehydrogenase E1 component
MQIQNANWQILNCTTPANFFHALRRQVIRDFRKPLVIATPKSLLRNKMAVSTLDEMAEDTKFKRVISERKKLSGILNF